MPTMALRFTFLFYTTKQNKKLEWVATHVAAFSSELLVSKIWSKSFGTPDTDIYFHDAVYGMLFYFPFSPVLLKMQYLRCKRYTYMLEYMLECISGNNLKVPVPH